MSITTTSRSDEAAAAGQTSPEAREAEQHDAHGRHTDAIDALARGTRQGHLDCMTRLGKRLLTGDRAPPMPREGARFIAEAAEAGGPEAGCRLATLLASGVFGPRNWDAALQALVRSAECGWVPARGQLAALGTDAALTAAALAAAALADAPTTDIWRRLADSVDLAAWLRSPDGIDLNNDPKIRTIGDTVPPALCAWMIQRARGLLVRARVYDPVGRRDFVTSERTNSLATFNLAETELVHLLLQARMAAACGLPMTHMEAPVLLRYTVGQEIANHYDFVDPDTPNYDEELQLNGQRVVTFLVYLNNEYDGGETAFPRMNITHRGRTGEGLYFVNSLPDGQPDRRTLHAGRPPTRGEKWIVSQFIRSRPVIGPLPDTPRYTAGTQRQA